MAQEAEKTEYTFITDTGAKITVPVDKYPTKEEAQQAAKQFKEDLIQRVYSDGLPPGTTFSVDTDVVGEKKQGFGANFLEGVQKNADDLYQNWMDTFTYSSTFKDDDAVVQRRQEIEQEIKDDLIRYGEVDSFQKFLDAYNDDDPDTSANLAFRNFLGETAGSVFVYGALPLVAVGGALLAGASVPLAVGAAIVAGLPAFFGNNIERQITEGADSVDDLKPGSAFVSALAQSTFDAALIMFTGGAGKVAKDAIIKTTKEAILATGGATVKGAGIELGTELTQTEIERLQAGLDSSARTLYNILTKAENEELSQEELNYLAEYLEVSAASLFAGGIISGSVKGTAAVTEKFTGERQKGILGQTEAEFKQAQEAKAEQRKQNDIEINSSRDFETPVPTAPSPVSEQESSALISNSITYTPGQGKGRVPAIAFEDVPADAKVRLHWNALEEKVDENGDPFVSFKPLIDPKTKSPVYGTYLMKEFIEDGQTTPDLSPAIKEQMKITVDNVDYFPQWEPGTKSFAEVPMGTGKEFLVSGRARSPKDPQFYDWLKYLGFDYVTKNFKPERTLPRAEWEQIIQRKATGERSELMLINDINSTIQKAIKKVDNTKTDITSLFEQKPFFDKPINFNDIQNKFLSGRINRKELFDYFEHSKQTKENKRKIKRVIDSFTLARTLIDQNSKKIDAFMHKVDPEMKKWPEQLRQTIKDNVSSYLTRSYRLQEDPKFKAPNRMFASASEKNAHAAAVTYLAGKFAEQGRPNPTRQAENLLDSIYKKETRLSDLFQEGSLPQDTNPGNSPTDSLKVSVDESILKARGDLPKEIRKAIGEITDPNAAFTVTAFKQADFLAGYEALYNMFDMANNPTNRWISRVPEGRYKVLLEGDETNPFSGYYTTKEFAAGINEAFNSGLFPDTLSNAIGAGGPLEYVANHLYAPLFLRPKTRVAEGKIVYSSKTQLRNLGSALGTVMVNGNISTLNPTAIKTAFLNASTYLIDNPKAKARRLSKLGLLDTAVNVGDLARQYELAGASNNILGSFQTQLLEENKFGLIGKAGRFLRDKPRQAYIFSDSFFKVLNFIGEESKYKKAFPIKTVVDDSGQVKIPDSEMPMYEKNMALMQELMYNYEPKLEGTTPIRKYNEMIEELAAYRTRNTVPNYPYVGRFIELLRVSPWSNYSSFPTEIFRTQYNIAAMAAKDIQVGQREGNGKLIQNGVARALSQMAYMGFMGLYLPAAFALRLGLVGGAGYLLSDWVADWAKDQNLIPYGYDPEKNEMEYVNGTHVDMYDQIASGIRAFYGESLRTVGSGAELLRDNLFANILRAAGIFASPYIEPSIWSAALLKAAQNYDSESGRKVTLKKFKEEPLGYFGDIITEFFFDIAPGFITQGERIERTMGEGLETLSDYNQPQDASDAIAGAAGLDVKTIRFNSSYAEFVMRDFVNEKKINNQVAFSEQAKGGRNLFDRAALLRSYSDANIRHRNLVNDHRQFLNRQFALSGRKPSYWSDVLSELNPGRWKQLGKNDQYNLYEEDANFIALDPKEYFSEFLEEAESALKEQNIIDTRVDMLKADEDEILEKMYKIFDSFEEEKLYEFDYSEKPSADWYQEIVEKGEDVSFTKKD
jgi:hypothetical protein